MAWQHRRERAQREPLVHLRLLHVAPLRAGLAMFGFQNLILGPLMLPLVTLPSAIRGHWRRYAQRHGAKLRPYGAIWFERMADELGKICEELQ